MKHNGDFSIKINPIVVVTFVAGLLIISFTELSFAENDNTEYKDISSFGTDKNKKTGSDEIKEKITQNNILNNAYPNNFFVCGYPQQIITNYNSFEKTDCD